MIPPIVIRVVPEDTTDEVEARWEHIKDLHPDWTATTYRDPIDPEQFPMSSPHWASCTAGAQLAGLVRLEALWIHGGIYLDSDVDVLRPLDPLRMVPGFAAWEDREWIPDAVIGARRGHPAIGAALSLAIARIPEGPQSSGPFVSTEIFRDHPGMFIHGPEAFYPYHYTEKSTAKAHEDYSKLPWCYGVHRWAGSWL